MNFKNNLGLINPALLVGVLVIIIILFVVSQIFLSNKIEKRSKPNPVISSSFTPTPYASSSNSRVSSPTPVSSTASVTASPKPTSTIKPTTPPINTSGTNTSYNVNVLVVKYFPLTSDGKYLNINVTGDVSDEFGYIRQKTESITQNLKNAIEKASRYLGYTNNSVPQSLNYNILEVREYNQAVPISSNGYRTTYPDYSQIMADQNICEYVSNRGVREVWLWAYQGPNKSDGQPYLGIDESKMSGPFGDISNSYRYNDMPVCNYSYRVYTFNYGRGTAEAFESWGHQLEAELDAVDKDLFRTSFQGPIYPQTQSVNGRCGSVHNPPNARSEYDRNNPNPQKSDCLSWNPDSLGSLTDISCQNWGCEDRGDSDNPALNYMVWMWQNMPGRENAKTYQGKKLRNWWDIHGDFDNVMRNNGRLTTP